jgi:hypothetical protein
MITVDPNDGYQVRDAETFVNLYNIPHSTPRWQPGTHKVLSLDNEPGRIFAYDMDTHQEEVLLQLPYQYITSSISYEEPSRDGQWMSVYVANDGSGNTRLLTVNLFQKRIAMNRRLQDMCAPDPQWGLLEPDWTGVSPNGNYAVVQWARDGTQLCSGMELYDIETGQFVRRIHTHHSHSDLGLTEDGREVLVSFELAHPDNGNYPAIILYWLDGSPEKYLRMVPWFRSDHVSAQGPPGVWLVTAGNEPGDPLLKGELFVVYEDGSLRRFAHHRSDSCDYWSQPKATMSVDGARVAFSSDWRGNCNQAGGFVIHNLKFIDTTPTPPTPTPTPTIALDRSTLTFGARQGGGGSSSQTFSISNSGAGTLNWSLSENTSWLSTAPASGSGQGRITVSVNPSGLSAGSYSGAVTASASGASNSPRTVTVTLNVYTSNQDSAPFGAFDSPTSGATARSSIAVTGWALDDIGVESVKIYRVEGGQNLFIGDAALVEGARPDVESANPGYPDNYKAGWGYMLLTNFLPGGGNGVFTLRAIARDSSGSQTILGSKTITADNAHAVKPFGAIDTPTQGGTASGGRFVNWGWALTPLPNSIPTDGSTIDVWIDGVNVGQPVYNNYRSDIAGLFPGYANSNGAVGYFYIDTNAYENGVHTIQWTASDSGGNSDGIGSRYFTVQNTGSRAKAQGLRFNAKPSPPNIPVKRDLTGNASFVRVLRGYNNNKPLLPYYPGKQGIVSIHIDAGERLEIHLPHRAKASPLPVGSTFDPDRGIFYWQPGPGFTGTYRFEFSHTDASGTYRKIKLLVKIEGKKE